MGAAGTHAPTPWKPRLGLAASVGERRDVCRGERRSAARHGGTYTPGLRSFVMEPGVLAVRGEPAFSLSVWRMRIGVEVRVAATIATDPERVCESAGA